MKEYLTLDFTLSYTHQQKLKMSCLWLIVLERYLPKLPNSCVMIQFSYHEKSSRGFFFSPLESLNLNFRGGYQAKLLHFLQ
uniref:Uncharacterized protein n=1 Tax=Anguilla anguilla TaxID=7936 RepID=A0A0E9TNN8_ANGAN